jgi:hypothetical protein
MPVRRIPLARFYSHDWSRFPHDATWKLGRKDLLASPCPTFTQFLFCLFVCFGVGIYSLCAAMVYRMARLLCLCLVCANFRYGSENVLKRLGSEKAVDKHLLKTLEMLNVKEHFTGSAVYFRSVGAALLLGERAIDLLGVRAIDLLGVRAIDLLAVRITCFAGVHSSSARASSEDGWIQLVGLLYLHTLFCLSSIAFLE